jgi:hypothetical protein
MTESPLEPAKRPQGVVVAVRTSLEAALFWVRRILGLAFSVLQRDSITTLRLETEQLGSAAVESASYVGAELRAIDERLTRLEEDLAAVRRMLEQGDRVTGDKPG